MSKKISQKRIFKYAIPATTIASFLILSYGIKTLFYKPDPKKQETITQKSSSIDDTVLNVDFLKQTIDEKNQYISFLQKEVENLTIMSMAKVPLLARIKMKLLKESSETTDRTKSL